MQPFDRRVTVKFSLTVGDRTIDAGVRVPVEPLRTADLLPVLRAFDDAVISMVVDSLQSQGGAVSCRAGCGACCRQLVPVSEPEAVALAELVQAMEEPRRTRIQEGFRAAFEALEPGGVLDRLRRPEDLRDVAARRALGMEYLSRGVPCPFLEDESCGIYAERPLACREYLVTSPRENCVAPSAETIRMVPMPKKLSEVLYTFGDGRGRESTRWTVLILALEFAAGPRAPERKFGGAELFRNFVSQVVGDGPRSDER